MTVGLAASLTPAAAIAERGINGGLELTQMSAGDLAARVAAYKAMGVKWVRVDFDWSVIQPNKKPYKWTGHDNAVRALTAADIQVLGLITYTPSWANGGQSTRFHPPTDPRTYATFAAAVAARYAPMGVNAWEVWNEPNLAQFWGPAPDPTAYTALLRLAYPAIKRANPRAFVVTGGLAQPGNSATSMESMQFLELMYGSGAKGFFDAVGNHPYTAPRMPLDGYNWLKMFATTPSMRSVMEQYGDGAKTIWITEYGGPTAGVSSWNTTMTELQQAEMVTQSLQLAASYRWAGPVFWYNFKDYCPSPGSGSYSINASTECFYGMVRYDGTPKPAHAAFSAAP